MLNDIEKFRFYAHKVLPLVYDDSLSYYEFLCKVVAKLNEVIELADRQNLAIEEVIQAEEDFEASVNERYDEFTTHIDETIDAFEREIREEVADFEGDITERQNQFEYNMGNRQSTFEGDMVARFTDFLEDYQRSFGIEDRFGNSRTEAISQRAVSQLVDFEENNNLLNPETDIDGYFVGSNGVLQATTGGIRTTTYIPVSAGNELHFQYDYNGTRYDSDNNTVDISPFAFIAGYSDIGVFVSGSYVTGAKKYTVPNGCTLVRVSYPDIMLASPYANVSLIVGDGTVTPYIPYGDQNVMVKSEVLPIDDSSTDDEHLWSANKTYNEITNKTNDLQDEIYNKILKPIPETINLYDEENNREILPNPQYSMGTVWLDGYYGDIVISTRANRAAYFTELHVYNENDEDMGVDYGEIVSTTTGGTRQGKVVTVPNGAKYLTFNYRTNSATSELISLVMVTKGSTLESGAYVPYKSHEVIVDTIRQANKYYPVYVSTTGSDNNDGYTPENAVASFEKALSLSNVIYVERGIYRQPLNIIDKNEIYIAPFDNDEEYSHADYKRQMIEINNADEFTYSELTLTSGTYRVNYEGGSNFTPVFVNHTLAPVISGTSYRCNVFVLFNTDEKIKLKPVLTLSECEGENNTFFWDGTIIYCNIANNSFEKIAIVNGSNTVNISNCSNIHIEDLKCIYPYTTCFKIVNSMNVKLVNCEGSYSATSMGIQLINTNGELVKCKAHNNGTDGFNFHGYGTSIMENCEAINNYDDGCSHHDACKGTIINGVFNGNTKAGIAPAYGGEVNISNIIAVGNGHYGVGFLTTNNGHPAMKGSVNSCVFKDNPIGLCVQALATVYAINCKYSSNASDKQISGTIYEY